MDLARN